MSRVAERATQRAANSPLQRAKTRKAERSGGSYLGSPGGGHYLGPAPPPLFTPPSAIRGGEHSHQSDAGATDVDAAAESHDFYATDADAKDENASDPPQGSRVGEAAARRLSPAERSFAATAFEPYYDTPLARDFAEASVSMDQLEEHQEKPEHAAAFNANASIDGITGGDRSGDRSGGGATGGWRVEALLEAVLATQSSQAAQLSALREALVHLSVTLDHLTPDLRPGDDPAQLEQARSSPDHPTPGSRADRTEEPPNDEVPTKTVATSALAPERTGYLGDRALVESREGAAAEVPGAGEAAVAAADAVGAEASALTPPVDRMPINELPAKPPLRVLAAGPPLVDREMKPLGSLAAATAAELRAVGFTAHNCLAAGLAPREVTLSPRSLLGLCTCSLL